MPTVSPSEYADRYRNLEVGFADGNVTVTIERYHTGNPDAESGMLVQAAKEFFQTQIKKDPNFKFELIINKESVETTYDEVKAHIAAPFWGKGSPEDCQIAAQLAVLTHRTTKDNLRKYCDEHLGLDCNGLVGNYFFHVRNPNGQSWKSTASAADLGPTSMMSQFARAGQPVRDIDAINPANIHLFLEVDAALNVIPGGSAKPGHIVITEPNVYSPYPFIAIAFGGGDARYTQKGAFGHPALWAVESTGPQGAIGLKESWYAIKQSVATQNQKNRGIYEVFRECKLSNLNFELVAFPPM